MIKLLLLLVLYFFILGAYFVMPLIGKLIVLVINACIADPLPLIDEIFMFFSLGKHIDTLTQIIDYIKLHKAKILKIVIAFIIIIVGLILFL